MRRFFTSLLCGGLLLACKEEKIVVIKADAAAPVTETKDAGKVVQPPDGTETDSGIAGRRLGDKGCKTDSDCDSGLCYIAASEPDNYCTVRCTIDSAKKDCIAPLTPKCSRMLVCEPPP